MKVNFDGIDKINSDYIQKDLKRMKDSEEKVENYASEDRVEISSRALDQKALQKAAMKESEVRTEQVSQIKTQVESGTYRIDHEKLAERLIQEHFVE